jgi:hypothetical protein
MSLLNQLRERYKAPEWALFFEVANGPGATLRRYADAIAMSLFPSRGLDIHGFEIKANRGDWLKELKEPEKAEEIASYCDYWWVVSHDDKAVLKSEVPRNWGLLITKDGALRQVKGAERLDPKPLDRKFVAAILRRADEWTTVQLRDDARVVAAQQAGRLAGLEEAKEVSGYAKQELDELRKRLADFQQKSGINVDNYHYGNIGEAVKAFLWAKKHESADELEGTANLIEASARTLRERARILKENRAACEGVILPK